LAASTKEGRNTLVIAAKKLTGAVMDLICAAHPESTAVCYWINDFNTCHIIFLIRRFNYETNELKYMYTK